MVSYFSPAPLGIEPNTTKYQLQHTDFMYQEVMYIGHVLFDM